MAGLAESYVHMHTHVHTHRVCFKTGTGGPSLLKQRPSPRVPSCSFDASYHPAAPLLDILLRFLPLHKPPVHLAPPANVGLPPPGKPIRAPLLEANRKTATRRSTPWPMRFSEAAAPTAAGAGGLRSPPPLHSYRRRHLPLNRSGSAQGLSAGEALSRAPRAPPLSPRGAGFIRGSESPHLEPNYLHPGGGVEVT